MKKTKDPSLNLLDLKPTRSLQWETEGNEQVVLLVPKFRNGFSAKWIMPRLTHPFIRVKLDEQGSVVWNLCDGNSTIFDIANKLKEKFGEDFDPQYERIRRFIMQLAKDDFLVFDNYRMK